MHVIVIVVVTLSATFLYYQAKLIGTQREEELTVLLIALAAGALTVPKPRPKVMQITDDKQWYYFIDAAGNTNRLPATRPFQTAFSPSRLDRLKYLKEFGGLPVIVCRL